MMSNAQEPAGVVIEDLNLSFGDTHVLKGVDLTIKQGEFLPSSARRVPANQPCCAPLRALVQHPADAF